MKGSVVDDRGSSRIKRVLVPTLPWLVIVTALVMVMILSGSPGNASLTTTNVSATFTLSESLEYWISPPLIPDAVQNIHDAASLEAEMRQQFSNQGVNVTNFRLGVLRIRDTGVSQIPECYPAVGAPTFGSSQGFACQPTANLTWDSSQREAIAIKIMNGGNGPTNKTFVWNGQETTPADYGFNRANTGPFWYLKAIPYDQVPPLNHAPSLFNLLPNVSRVEKLVPSTSGANRQTWLGFTGQNFTVVRGEAYRFGFFANSGGAPVTLSGTVYDDRNGTHMFDTGDAPLVARKVKISSTSTGLTFTVLSSPNGQYQFKEYLGPGGASTYTLSVVGDPMEVWSPASYSIPLSTGGTASGRDFGRDPIHDLGLSIYPVYTYPNRSPCSTAVNPTMSYCIHYVNRGSFSEHGADVTLQLPGSSQATYVSYSLAGTCTAPPGVLSGPTGGLLTWDIPSFPLPGECTVCAKVQVLQPVGDILTATANIYLAGGSQDVFTSTHNSESTSRGDVCAIDPNDKRVEPQGCGGGGYIGQVQELEYLVRFQNTGNGTATEVVIRDILDSSLDLSTFEVVGTSHPLTKVDLESGVLVWTFQNINLPPASQNEPASHGHVLYRIKTKPALAEGRKITNSAGIYFDANPPVITNAVLNTVTNHALPPGGQPVQETCNNVDDDCDGSVDESCDDGNPCTVGDTCSAGSCVSGPAPTPVQLCNAASLLIRDGTAPTTASVYPTSITVSGLGPVLCKATMNLNGLQHTFPDDIDMLLAGPSPSQNAIVLSDVGGGTAITGINLTLDDAAGSSIPNSAPITSGTFKPTNVNAGSTGTEAWPGPAPAPGGGSALSIFNLTNPNGTWSLYIVDDENIDSGRLVGGWCLNLAAAPCSTAANCNDNSQCTTDSCNAGICQYTSVNCIDGDACTQDNCDPGTGLCPHGPTNCNDANVCTTDSCDTITGCAHTPVPLPIVTGLKFAPNKHAITWIPVAGGSPYDIIYGDLVLLHSAGLTASMGGCLGDNSAPAGSDDADTPAPGQGFWYLARSRGCGGVTGTYNSGGSGQVANRDPLIPAPPVDCSRP